MATPSKPPHQPSPPQPQHPTHPASPPAKHKDNLKSWWRKFTKDTEHQESRAATKPPGIFGVPLRQSITYANVAISLVDDDGKSYIYGYVPIVVAKCGVFLKEKATSIEGIFRLSGSEKRIKELKLQFDSPDRYGKGLVWDGFTVHDAANVLRRYLNDLPEPVVPLDLYEQFRGPLRGHTKQAVGDSEGSQLLDNFNEAEAIQQYQQLIKELPPLNRQLLLYILDLLAVFAAKAEENRMTAENLAAIFQPGMLSHPSHAMAPEEYRLNQCVIIFLINKQDNFLIGMQGTGTDEKTKLEIEKGTPTIVAPSTPARKSGVHRSASNSSAAADSISRDGMIRRNRSVSSRHSRHSNGAATPSSPAHAATPSSGLGRSNTVPSKKSPHVPSGRFQGRQDSPSAAAAPSSPSPAGASVATPPTVSEEATATNESPMAEGHNPSANSLMPGAYVPAKLQDRSVDSNNETSTPSKDKGLQAIFNRSPTENNKRQPNKLQKKRVVSSNNPSAHSSTVSLAPHIPSGPPTPALDLSAPAEEEIPLAANHAPENASTIETPSEPTPRASQVPSMTTFQQGHESNNSLKPKPSSPTSLHSSLNDASDPDPSHDESTQQSTAEQTQSEKDKKKFFRLSRRKDDLVSPTFPLFGTSNNNNSEVSASSSGSAQKPRKSWTGESTDVPAALLEGETGSREKDDTKGPMKWIKNKMREAKENAEHKRAKSPPADNSHGSLPLELKRTNEERLAASAPSVQSPVEPKNPVPQDIPLPMSPPATQTTHNTLGPS